MLKAMRVVRNVDRFGRIKLPAEMMKALDITPGDYLEFFLNDGLIELQKNEKACVFCGQSEELHSHKSKLVCIKCLRSMDGLEFKSLE